MTVYVSIIFISVLFDLICKATHERIFKKILLILLFTYITYISAIRVGIGTDYKVYENYYSLIKIYGFENISVEKGYGLLNEIVISLGLSSRIIYVISSILISAALYYFIIANITSSYWCFAVFLYVGAGFYFNSLNLLRQFMAIAIGIIAFNQYIKKRKKLCFALLVTAFFFHSSAVVLVMLLFMNWILRTSRKYLWITLMFVASVVLSASGVTTIINSIAMLNPHWAVYVGSETSRFFTDRNSSAILKLIVPLTIVIIGLIQDYKIETNLDGLTFNTNRHYSIMLSGTLCYILLQMIGFGLQPIYRIGLYFFPFFISYTCHVICRQKKNMQWLFWIAAIIYFILLTYITVFLWNGSGVMPYQSIYGSSIL